MESCIMIFKVYVWMRMYENLFLRWKTKREFQGTFWEMRIQKYSALYLTLVSTKVFINLTV